MTMRLLNSRYYGRGIVDHIHAQNRKMTVTEMLTQVNVKQTFGLNTIYLAEFEGNLEAGNIFAGGEPLLGWRLKRTDLQTGKTEIVEEFIEKDIQSYIDITPRNEVNYEYAIFTVFANGEGSGKTVESKVGFYGWVFTDSKTHQSFMFNAGWDSGVESGEISYNKDMFQYNNYQKKPIVSYGVRNYKTGNIKTVPYEFTGTGDNIQYDISNYELIAKLDEFINNGNTKMLRNTKGELFYVCTSNLKLKYEDILETQPYSISFDWIEVEKE